jgi:hypothetical protein
MCGDSTVSQEPCWKFDNKRDNLREIVADNLKKAGWSLGYVSAIDSEGRTIWIVDAHRGDGKRFAWAHRRILESPLRVPKRCQLFIRPHNVAAVAVQRKAIRR